MTRASVSCGYPSAVGGLGAADMWQCIELKIGAVILGSLCLSFPFFLRILPFSCLSYALGTTCLSFGAQRKDKSDSRR